MAKSERLPEHVQSGPRQTFLPPKGGKVMSGRLTSPKGGLAEPRRIMDQAAVVDANKDTR